MKKISPHQATWIRRLARVMPLYNHLGLRLSKLGWARSEMRIKIGKELTQDTGVAHGGVLASLVDSVVGLALYTMLTPNDLITTIELKINFIMPAKPGVLTGVGKIFHKGKRIAVGDAEVRDEEGMLIAKGLVTCMVLSHSGQRVLNLS